MGRMKKLAKNKAKTARLPSEQTNATVNRAGGVSFDITVPAIKLMTMTGGSFFMEPRYYDADKCVPKREAGGKLGKLQERLKLAKNKSLEGSKALKESNVNELDELSREVMATAWDVLNSDNPSDLLKIAHWLRREMNIRMTPQVLLVLASQHPNGKPFVREYTPKIIARPDEIKTVILMHRFFFGMKNLKNCLRYGLSDAMAKMGERGLIKYEGKDFPSWKDVLFMVAHAKDYPLSKPVAEYFMFGKVSDEAPIASARKQLAGCKKLGTKAKNLISTSFANWEVVLSQFGQTAESKKEVWEYLIKENLVGYMAMMRNLRNVLQAGVGGDTVKRIHDKLSDPEQVKRSRQLPFRFAMAAKVLGADYGITDRWYYDRDVSNQKFECNEKHRSIIQDALENAADEAVINVPELPGVTAVFADNSGSMSQMVSEKSKVSCALAANMLGGIVAKRSANARVCAFGTDVKEVNYTKRTRVLEFVGKLAKAETNGCSTNTHRCAQWLMKNGIAADRVIILSDMQCWDSRSAGSRRGLWGYSDQSFADEWFKYKKSNKDTWLHCVNLNGYGDSMVDDKSDKVNLVGAFSEKIISMLLVTEGVMTDAVPTLEQLREKW